MTLTKRYQQGDDDMNSVILSAIFMVLTYIIGMYLGYMIGYKRGKRDKIIEKWEKDYINYG